MKMKIRTSLGRLGIIGDGFDLMGYINKGNMYTYIYIYAYVKFMKNLSVSLNQVKKKKNKKKLIGQQGGS